MCGLNITLNASEKSLKEQIIDFINKIIEDLKVIDTQENKVEILTEYKRCLNLSKSMIIVADRKKEIEQERKRQEELVQKRLEEETKAAVEQLQSDSGKKVDGIVGPQTWSVLNSDFTKPETTYPLGLYVVISQNGVNVRSTPDTENDNNIVETYPFGTRFDTRSIQGMWAKNIHGNWIRLDNCKLVTEY